MPFPVVNPSVRFLADKVEQVERNDSEESWLIRWNTDPTLNHSISMDFLVCIQAARWNYEYPHELLVVQHLFMWDWPYWGRSWDGLTGSTIPSSRSCLFASSCPSSSRERCSLTGLRPQAMWSIGQSFVAIWQRDHIPTSSKFPCCFFLDLAEWVEHNGEGAI